MDVQHSVKIMCMFCIDIIHKHKVCHAFERGPPIDIHESPHTLVEVKKELAPPAKPIPKAKPVKKDVVKPVAKARRFCMQPNLQTRGIRYLKRIASI